ncbi:MAG: hypothetical protein U9Q15_04215 [Patescibacteria group bacterium]|nr:hypothetical protein [Patescibacteria group bacterium]
MESSVYSLSQKIAQTQNKPDYILNIGVCGVVSSPEEVLPVIQAYRTIKRSTEKELVTPLTHMSYPLKTILCSDLVVTADDQMGKHEYVDMESYGIAYVCEKEKIPYSIIKSVFDTVGPLSKQVDL